ncbi:MAG: glycosyltransferase [Hydrococcus sp. Prado102]|jgi:glycosyltransferase involved in cell wall biosynthesis|nr:glycosyltransferase [Hydrococcus sp. Prado102]
MLNRKSNYLVILIATYNRLNLLKRALNSIATNTRCSHEIIVIDGGSSDGTIEYLKSNPNVTPVFQGELLGAARAYNQVWKQVESQYTCWLSDDTEIVAGSLDLAVNILKNHPSIGMVGLKMKDTTGESQIKPYMGAISEYGIINCNHGVLATSLLRSLGYFNESYRTYGIDPDLTASVLCTGKSTVMTKQVSVLHHRVDFKESTPMKERESDGENIRDEGKSIYHEKFQFLAHCDVPYAYTKALLKDRSIPFLYPSGIQKWNTIRLGLNYRDWRNIIRGKFVKATDPLDNLLHPYHLVQQLPRHLLLSAKNPYRHILTDQ